MAKKNRPKGGWLALRGQVVWGKFRTMGMIRLLLALAVVFGHAVAFGIIPPYTARWGYFPVDATLAVELFFVLSGFYMGLVLDVSKVRGWVGRFYLNRYLRLMLTYAAVASVVCYFNPILLTAPLDAAGIAFRFSSVTLFGIDLTAFYTLAGGPAHAATPINQAWSLGIEIEFYIIAPLLVQCRTRTLVVLLAVAFGARLLTSDLALYVQQRVFPLSIYFFLLGLLSHRLYRANNLVKFGPIAFAVAVFIAAFSGYAGGYAWSPLSALGYTAALALSMPSIFSMTRDWKFDRRIGELSYPVYLVHIAVGQFLPWARADLATFMAVSIAAALPFFFVIEWNMDAIRKWILEPRFIKSQRVNA